MSRNKKPNCGNCPNWKGHWDVPFCKYWDEKIPITKYGMDLIAHVGCLSHPGAREYLMAPVIKKLEERIDMFSKEAVAKDNYCLSYRAAGLAEAISLIKNGVGK